MNDLKRLSLQGGLAKIGAKGADFVLRMGSLMVLARLLEPRDFGLVGMVSVITGVLSIFKEFGLSTATVQRATVSEEQTSTLFWVNVAVGMSLSLVSIAISPFVAAFYHEPRLILVMAALGSGFVFNAAGVQHSALLQRQMRFTTLAVIEVVSLLISSGISIAVAAWGYGYWALVAWSVTLPLASTVLTWFASAWVPGWPRRNSGIGSMMRFGSIVTLNGLVVYVAYHLDQVLLGRFWGAEVVGIYGRAYQLVTLPTDYMNGATGSVAIPVLSRLQDDSERLRNYFLKGYSLVLASTIPTTAACALFANELILVIFGPKWSDAVQVFRFLTPTILVFALINPTGWLLIALGRVARSLKLALAIAPLVITGCVLGLPYGAKGVALGYSAAMTLWVVPHLIWCFHGLPVSWRDVLIIASRPLISVVVAGCGSLSVLFFVGPSPSPLARLLLGGTVLVGLYTWVLLFLMGQKTVYLDVLRGLRAQSTASVCVSTLSDGPPIT